MIADRYYYYKLNKQERAIYKAFYNGVMLHQKIIPIPVRDKFSQESFERIFLAMTRDNPLIYFLNQSALIRHKGNVHVLLHCWRRKT